MADAPQTHESSSESSEQSSSSSGAASSSQSASSSSGGSRRKWLGGMLRSADFASGNSMLAPRPVQQRAQHSLPFIQMKDGGSDPTPPPAPPAPSAENKGENPPAAGTAAPTSEPTPKPSAPNEEPTKTPGGDDKGAAPGGDKNTEEDTTPPGKKPGPKTDNKDPDGLAEAAKKESAQAGKTTRTPPPAGGPAKPKGDKDTKDEVAKGEAGHKPNPDAVKAPPPKPDGAKEPAPKTPGGGKQGPAPSGGGAPAGPGMQEWMASHKDKGCDDKLTAIKAAISSSEAGQRSLNAGIAKKPSDGVLGLFDPRNSFHALNQKLAKNPFKGEDSAANFIAQFNAALDFIRDIVGKVGLAATIGGAILTLFLPPVGAFLMAAGRVANGISAILAGVRVVTSIVQTVMIAYRMAKEPDPGKRMEMLGAMQSEIQAGVGAGIELILNKLGGKAKGGGAKASGGIKEGFKQGGLKGAAGAAVKKAGGALKGIKESVVGGVKGAGQGLAKAGTAVAEAFKAGGGGALGVLKGAANVGKLGLTAVGKGIAGGVKGAGKALFGEGADTLKAGWKDAGKAWKDGFSGLKSAADAGGKSFAGRYKDYLKETNFSNYGKAAAQEGAGFVDKAKGLGKDLFDSSAGGYATNVKKGLIGNEKFEKQTKAKEFYEKGLASNDPNVKMDALEAGDKGLTTGVDDLGSPFKEGYWDPTRPYWDYTPTELDNVLKSRLYEPGLIDHAAKGLATGMATGSAAGGLKTAVTGAMGGSATTEVAGKLVMPDTTGATGVVKSGRAKGAADIDSGSSGAVGRQADTPMVKHQDGDVKAAEFTSATVADLMAKFASVAPLITRRVATQPGGGAIVESMGEGGGAQSAPKPPKGPPDDMKLPDEAYISGLEGERKRADTIIAAVETDIADATAAKATAQKELEALMKAKGHLGEAAGEVSKQKSEAQADATKVAQSEQKQKSGNQKVAAKKDTAQSGADKGKTAANQGSNLQATPDPAAKEKRIQERAKQEKSWWDKAVDALPFSEYLKKAASWVWKKVLEPAIAAVKKALATVMGYFTDLVTQIVMKVVGSLMSETEAGRLNETWTAMQKQKAEAAKEKAAVSEQAIKEQQAAADSAYSKELAEIARCDANIAKGNALKKQLEGNQAKIDAESKMAKAQIDTFKAQFGPYFEWVDKGADSGGGAGGPAGGGAAPAPGGGKAKGGGAPDPNRPLDPKVAETAAAACDTALGASKAAQTDAGTEIDTVVAGAKAQTTGMTEENWKAQYIDCADTVGKNCKSSHSSMEGARQGRIQKLRAQAANLATLPGPDGVKAYSGLMQELMKEAGEIDKAKSSIVTKCKRDIATGFNKITEAMEAFFGFGGGDGKKKKDGA